MMRDNKDGAGEGVGRDKASKKLLMSFFIGAIILFLALKVNSVVKYQGFWPDMGRVVVDSVIYCVAAFVSFIIFVISASLFIFFRKEGGGVYKGAGIAALLHGAYVVTIGALFLHFIYFA
ncbi:hypothetical protein [Erwinia aphidicola]|uniref:hypothetical protein n=1 Tax=Erwinia aphidicola TaxID=68334 RepID=UPI002585D8E7|nr:hypothetical protein [uncultured Erwinia sp.]